MNAPTTPEEIEVARLGVEISKLTERKDHLDNLISARRLVDVVALLSQCTFQVTDMLSIEIDIPKEIEKAFEAAVNKVGDGGYHFEFALSEQIRFRGDDGRYVIQFDPACADQEALKVQCDSKFMFDQVVSYLVSIGVKQGQFKMNRIEESIQNLQRRLAKEKDTLSYAIQKTGLAPTA